MPSRWIFLEVRGEVGTSLWGAGPQSAPDVSEVDDSGSELNGSFDKACELLAGEEK